LAADFLPAAFLAGGCFLAAAAFFFFEAGPLFPLIF